MLSKCPFPFDRWWGLWAPPLSQGPSCTLAPPGLVFWDVVLLVVFCRGLLSGLFCIVCSGVLCYASLPARC